MQAKKPRRILMRNRIRLAAAGTAVTAALAGGSFAIATAASAAPSTPATTVSAVQKCPAGGPPAGAKIGAKPGSSSKAAPSAAQVRQHQQAMAAAVARQLHVSTARASAALQSLFAAGRADTSSAMFAAAARSLGVSVQQLNNALIHAKESLAPGSPAS
jgi:hypothetical protein